jgi:hypothetical protein
VKAFNAEVVHEMARSFEQLRRNCELIERFGLVHFDSAEIDFSKMRAIELLPSRTPMQLLPEWKKSVVSMLTYVEKHCGLIGLNLAAQAARDYRAEVEAGHIATYGSAAEAS